MSSSEEPEVTIVEDLEELEVAEREVARRALERARAYGFDEVVGQGLIDTMEEAAAGPATDEVRERLADQLEAFQRQQATTPLGPSDMRRMVGWMNSMMEDPEFDGILDQAMGQLANGGPDLRHQALAMVAPDALEHGEDDPDHQWVYLLATLTLAYARAPTPRDRAYLQAMAAQLSPAVAERYAACVRAPVTEASYFEEFQLCGACAPAIADMHEAALAAIAEHGPPGLK